MEWNLNVPSELKCSICASLIVDAVMMPCCAGVACDVCARSSILVRDAGKCPMCKEGTCTDELIPYRLLREKVDRYKKLHKAAVKSPGHACHEDSPVDSIIKAAAMISPTVSLIPQLVQNSVSNPAVTAVAISPLSTSPQFSDPPVKTSRCDKSEILVAEDGLESSSPGTPYSQSDVSASPVTPTPFQTPPKDLRTDTQPDSLIQGPTLLPPCHVLTAVNDFPQPPPNFPPVPSARIDPTEDPLSAFEAAMRNLDSRKANRSRHKLYSPPKAYRFDRYSSRSSNQRKYSPWDRSVHKYDHVSKTSSRYVRRELSPAGSASHGPVDYRYDHYERPRRERYVSDIPPETEVEKLERERYESKMAAIENRRRKPQDSTKNMSFFKVNLREPSEARDKSHSYKTGDVPIKCSPSESADERRRRSRSSSSAGNDIGNW